ncbi:MAG: hypothetical protein F6K26_28760 [Moorea sp. SIO2I5]|nr:hypothetical protein [Moorena sp. SIO2I5]
MASKIITIPTRIPIVDLLQKYFSDSVYVNSCPLFPIPCSLFPTTAAKSSNLGSW